MIFMSDAYSMVPFKTQYVSKLGLVRTRFRQSGTVDHDLAFFRLHAGLRTFRDQCYRV